MLRLRLPYDAAVVSGVRMRTYLTGHTFSNGMGHFFVVLSWLMKLISDTGQCV